MPPSLRRELTYISATAIVVANMIGTGIFSTTGFLAGDLGRPWLVLAIWAAGALVALMGCLCYMTPRLFNNISGSFRQNNNVQRGASLEGARPASKADSSLANWTGHIMC